MPYTGWNFISRPGSQIEVSLPGVRRFSASGSIEPAARKLIFPSLRT
jgi:hypothetical protein